MAPAKLPPCKICHKKDLGKYRCPIDHVDYCSVVCFKQHKQDGCRSESTYQPPPLNPILKKSNPQDKEEEDDSDGGRPRKRLKDLIWPVEPNPMLWDDPLKRDDLKPLRPFELEAIATDPNLRSLLSSPSLQTTLTRLTSLPRHLREPSLRTLIDLAPEPTPDIYRPDPSRRFQTGVQTKGEIQQAERGNSSNHSGRGGRGGGRGGRQQQQQQRGMRLLESTESERKEVEKFAEAVRTILDEARKSKG